MTVIVDLEKASSVPVFTSLAGPSAKTIYTAKQFDTVASLRVTNTHSSANVVRVDLVRDGTPYAIIEQSVAASTPINLPYFLPMNEGDTIRASMVAGSGTVSIVLMVSQQIRPLH